MFRAVQAGNRVRKSYRDDAGRRRSSIRRPGALGVEALREPNVQDQPPARSRRARSECNTLEVDELIRSRPAGRLDCVVW